jgi:hypothetical protein
VETTWAATRTKNTFYNARYHRLAARRDKKRTLIAVGHSILKSVYRILSTSSVYRELGANHVNLRAEAKRKSYLRKELEKLGYEVRLTSSKIYLAVNQCILLYHIQIWYKYNRTNNKTKMIDLQRYKKFLISKYKFD